MLVNRECELVYGQGSKEVSEGADAVTMFSVPETQEETVRGRRVGKEPITEEDDRQMPKNTRVVGERNGREIHGDIELENILTHIDNEIADADILGAQDWPPCFGDEMLQTQEFKNGEYDPRNDGIFVGKVFKNKQAMQTALGVYAVKSYFSFKQVKSDTKRLIVECVDSRCPWRVYGHLVRGSSHNLEISTANLMHTCDVATRSEYGKKATSKVIAEVISVPLAYRDGPELISYATGTI